MIPLVDRTSLPVVAVLSWLSARYDPIGGQGSVTSCSFVIISQYPL